MTILNLKMSTFLAAALERRLTQVHRVKPQRYGHILSMLGVHEDEKYNKEQTFSQAIKQYHPHTEVIKKHYSDYKWPGQPYNYKDDPNCDDPIHAEIVDETTHLSDPKEYERLYRKKWNDYVSFIAGLVRIRNGVFPEMDTKMFRFAEIADRASPSFENDDHKKIKETPLNNQLLKKTKEFDGKVRIPDILETMPDMVPNILNPRNYYETLQLSHHIGLYLRPRLHPNYNFYSGYNRQQLPAIVFGIEQFLSTKIPTDRHSPDYVYLK
jgi:hypothetical protein